MSKIDKIRFENTDYDIVTGDNLPVGTEVDVDDTAEIPTGWQLTSETTPITLTTPFSFIIPSNTRTIMWITIIWITIMRITIMWITIMCTTYT